MLLLAPSGSSPMPLSQSVPPTASTESPWMGRGWAVLSPWGGFVPVFIVLTSSLMGTSMSRPLFLVRNKGGSGTL